MERQSRFRNQLKTVKNYLDHFSYQEILSNFLRHPLIFACLVLSMLLTTGTVGYMLIEGWAFSDAFFMTVITVTTIGYGEVLPLSHQGRIFTIGLIIIGVITATYAIGATIELFTSEEFLGRIRNRRRRAILQKLKNHTIICGFGRMGSSLADELLAGGSPIVVIDLDSDVIEQCQQQGIPVIQGSASDEEILREAGIGQAKALVAATRTDAENVFIVLTARSINRDLHIITRSNAKATVAKMEKAGADTVISPYVIAGKRIAHMLTHPNIIRFLDGFLTFGGQQMRLEEFIIYENSPVAGMTLREAKLGVSVLAVNHPGQQISTRPDGDTVLLPGTAIIVMGVEEDLRKAEKAVLV